MNAEEMFRKSGAILDGHFILTSGRHSPVYWEKFKVMQYPQYVQQLCGMIAEHYRKESIDLVAGPTTAGIILAFEVARQMGIRAIYAEKAENKTFAFKRGAAINPGDALYVTTPAVYETACVLTLSVDGRLINLRPELPEKKCDAGTEPKTGSVMQAIKISWKASGQTIRYELPNHR